MSASTPAAPHPPRLTPIIGFCQQYDWGKIGTSSTVAQLQAASRASSTTGFTVDQSKPYAELWMGTHPSGPSRVRVGTGAEETTQTLREYLGGRDLPFLFKVLSVNKALSIQAHPDRTLAQRLHSTKPDLYKDPNHKPELACALTPFEAMCAFRPIEQIVEHARKYPEFAALMGAENFTALQELVKQGKAVDQKKQKSVLKSLFGAMMTPTSELLKSNLDALLNRLRAAGFKPSSPACENSAPPVIESSSSFKLFTASSTVVVSSSSASQIGVPLAIEPLLLRLSDQYPGDVGIFAPLYLNAFTLQCGQALFLGPNEPHAYLSGDCIECMACSDNVVRAGLTPKFRDTQELIQMLTYETHTIEEAIMTKTQPKEFITQFTPPQQFNEFRLYQIELPKGQPISVETQPVVGVSIGIVTHGAGTITSIDGTKLQVMKGDIVLIPEQGVKVQTDGKEGLQLFQCTNNQ